MTCEGIHTHGDVQSAGRAGPSEVAVPANTALHENPTA